ncbi:MAG: hypothetical protein LC730_02660, partial [Acidobacteria bacterium]|nr:hypothetical protein [Acidobacteriota bacterium]
MAQFLLNRWQDERTHNGGHDDAGQVVQDKQVPREGVQVRREWPCAFIVIDSRRLAIYRKNERA